MQGLGEAIERELGGEVREALGRQLGVDNETAGQLIGAALPTILAGLQRNSRQPEGAEALHRTLGAKHDGSVLDDVLGYVLAGGDVTDGRAILGHVFGGRQEDVAAGVGKASSVDGKLLGQAMAILAPIVLGYLGRRMRSGGLDSGGLSDVLARGGPSAAGQAAPDLGAILGPLLEGMVAGSPSAPSAASGGLLGRVLGSLMRGRR